MTRLRKLAGLSSVERLWLIKVALLPGMIRLALRLLGFRTLWRLLSHARPTAAGVAARRSDSAGRSAPALPVGGGHPLLVKPCPAQALAPPQTVTCPGVPPPLALGR